MFSVNVALEDASNINELFEAPQMPPPRANLPMALLQWNKTELLKDRTVLAQKNCKLNLKFWY